MANAVLPCACKEEDMYVLLFAGQVICIAAWKKIRILKHMLLSLSFTLSLSLMSMKNCLHEAINSFTALFYFHVYRVFLTVPIDPYAFRYVPLRLLVLGKIEEQTWKILLFLLGARWWIIDASKFSYLYAYYSMTKQSIAGYFRRPWSHSWQSNCWNAW